MRNSKQPVNLPGGSKLPGWSGNNRWLGILWILATLLFAYYWASTLSGSPVQQLTYTQFEQAVRNDRVAAVTLSEQEIRGTFKRGNGISQKEGAGAARPPGVDASKESEQQFVTTRPPIGGEKLMELLQAHHVEISAKASSIPWWQQLLVGLLPWVLIFGVFFYFYRVMQRRMMGAGGGPGGLFGMGRSRAERFREHDTGVTMDDVAGAEQAKRDLYEIVDFLKNPERYHALDAKIPRGVLMLGPPGVGKTLLAKAVASEAKVPFYSISGSEFIEMFVGVGAARVRDMFEKAKAEAPALIFIDEIDSIGRSRGTGVGGGHDEREQTLNQILSEMDGFKTTDDVVILAATNRPDVLDPALLRPGRFDRKVVMEKPNRKAREAILRVHARSKPLAHDVDLAVIAGRTTGFSGADLANLLNEAALLAGRDHRKEIDMALVNRARDRLIMGVRRDAALSDEEKRVVAYHESGHAQMAYLLPKADPLDKVTIIPRGRALGATEQIPAEDRYHMPASYLRDRIGVILGGYVAENLVFGEVGTGAEHDLKQATQLARRMVANWGMNVEMGPVAYQQGEQHPFLGRELSHPRDYSERTAYQIDLEVRKLLAEVADHVRNIMQEHRDGLDALAAALLEEETLGAAEITELFAGLEAEGESKQ